MIPDFVNKFTGGKDEQKEVSKEALQAAEELAETTEERQSV